MPLVAQTGHLTVWWIYGVTFIQSTIFIAFSAGEFAAIPSLVASDDLVTANGRSRPRTPLPRLPGRCSQARPSPSSR